MKKLLFTFALLGLFALSVPKDSNAQLHDLTLYPGTFDICGHTCFCWDFDDYFEWGMMYC